MLAAASAPMLGNLLTITGTSPFPRLDLTPFGFTIAGLAVTWSLFHSRLLDIIPVARDFVIENMPDLVIVLDARERIVDANPAARRVFGVLGANIIGMPIQQALPRQHDLVQLCRGSQRTSPEIILGEGKGQLCFDLNISPLHNRQDNPIGCLLVLRDITQRKIAEGELRKAHDLLEAKVEERTAEIRTILEASPDAITVTDLEGHVTECNQATLDIHGYSSKGEVIGRSAIDLIAKGDHTRAMENLERTLEEGVMRNIEYTLIRRDGREFPGELSVSVIRDSSHSPLSFVAVTKDITERKRAEEQLKEYSGRLEDLVEERTCQLRDAERMAAIGETTTMVGHDLRNPLQAIVNNIYLAKKRAESLHTPDEQLETKQKLEKSLETINDRVTYMNKIVLDLQDYARPVKPKAVKTNMEKLIDDIISTIKIPESIKTSTRIDEELGELMVDRELLRRTLTNLVTNAVQAMPKGGRLTITLCREDQEVLINIRDTGVGMPEEDLEKIFSPLFTTKSQGQGFGLAVCKRLVEVLGGSIRVNSKLGEGSTFTIHLPIHPGL